jgi:hypothetical protein
MQQRPRRGTNLAANMSMFLAVAGSVTFLVVQFMNLWPRRFWRIMGTLVALGLEMASVALHPSEFGAAVFCTVVALLIVSSKWVNEVEDDIEDRRAAGLQPLLGRGSSVALYLSPAYALRYRRRLFRDPWSRANLLERSGI